MKTPITDRRIEILQYLFDNDAIATEEIKELIELKAMKEALSKSIVGQSSPSRKVVRTKSDAKMFKKH